MNKFTTIRMIAKNDTNGNPRRVFVTFCEGEVVKAYDEGYAGKKAITNRNHRSAYKGYDVDVPVREYDMYMIFADK